MTPYHIAVLDIGKTNKKILVYDHELKCAQEKYAKIEEIEEKGVWLDDVASLQKWILNTLTDLSKDFNIKVIATSAHGATYSLVDETGQQVVPQVAYTTDPGDEFHEDFYQKFGDPVDLQQKMATPNFNLLINVAKGIYFTQSRYPDLFKKVKNLVLYPQFFGSWLTGNVCADPTYVGNHTYLWDFQKNDWSELVDLLKIREILPDQFLDPWSSLGVIKVSIARQTGLSADTIVTAGIHDSNASLLPYMISMEDQFLLNSTGTWCVIMNEKEEVRFEEDELGKVVFYNMNAFWKPVKTAIFLGGMEFEHYAGLLQKLHGRNDYPLFDESIYQEIISDCAQFILPSVARGIGQFPDSQPRVIDGDQVYKLDEVENGTQVPNFFNDYEKALAVLNLSLAVQTKVSFERADMRPGLQVFTEGGFSKNDSYNTLMTSFFPKSRFYLTDLKEASAFGAAMTGKVAYEDIDIASLKSLVEIDRKPVPTNGLTGLEAYAARMISLI